MVDDTDNVTPGSAREALESIEKFEGAGWRRAVPARWFGPGIAILVASLFALYALEDPYPYIVFPILGFAVLITASREKVGAYGRDFPDTRANRWSLAIFVAVMLVMFFGSIFIRRMYDAAWVSLVAGLLAGLIVFFLSESERRAYLAKAQQKR